MEDKVILGIIGFIVLGIVSICFLAYLHSSRQPLITREEIEKAREVVRRLEV